jgi:uncharacterized RDD family membrane protein YckC
MNTETDEKKWISGFWRRIGALFIDSLILGISGFALGLALEEQFVELGGYGRFVGFFIALMYFGLLNSSIFNGQTLGKKALGIKVVDANNHPIEVSRSFARYSILGVPFFLNGAHFTNNALTSYWLYPLSLVVFGGLLSIIYLYVFNRQTRQSLHDLVIGTFVVNAKIEQEHPGTVWKPHLVVVGIFFFAAALVPALTSNMAQNAPFKELLAVQSEVMKHPLVSHVTVTSGHSSLTSGEGVTRTTKHVGAQIFLKENVVSDIEVARQFAETLAKTYPESLEKDVIQVSLAYGYDIGIASQWRNYIHNFNPNENF